MINPPKFFSWVSQDFKTANEVPERLRKVMRLLWLNGSRPDEIALAFEVPVEWVEDFVREPEDIPPKTH